MLRTDSLSFVLCLALALIVNCEELRANDSELKLLHVVFRHGDRAPITLYPNDPNPASYWKEGLGGLSLRGKMQHYVLGKFLKERYKDYLTGNPREIYVRSSGKDRCLESAESNLASLYAPPQNWTWNSDMNWQPIPIQTVPLPEDGMLNPSSKCAAADEERERIQNLPASQEFYAQQKELFETVGREIGATLKTWDQLSYVYDTLKIERAYGLKIPEWAPPLWQNMSYVNNMSFYLSFQTKEIQRLRAGMLLGDMADHMRTLRDNASAQLPRLYLYSTHDTQVAALINALGVRMDTAPNYCATVLVELRHSNSTGRWELQVLLLDSPTPEIEPQIPQPLNLPGCDGPVCSLDKFLSLVQPMEIHDWNEACGQAHSSFPRPAIMVISLLSVALLLVVAFCGFLLCRRPGMAPPPYHSLNAS